MKSYKLSAFVKIGETLVRLCSPLYKILKKIILLYVGIHLTYKVLETNCMQPNYCLCLISRSSTRSFNVSIKYILPGSTLCLNHSGTAPENINVYTHMGLFLR